MQVKLPYILIILIAVCILIGVIFKSENLPYKEDCRDRMNHIALGLEKFHKEYKYYTDNLDSLRNYVLISVPLNCPVNIVKFIFKVSNDSYEIICPNDHGKIKNGIASW